MNKREKIITGDDTDKPVSSCNLLKIYIRYNTMEMKDM